jgi:hypothetical protein
MKVLARKVNHDECPPLIASLGYGQPHNVRITAGRTYVVYAISLFRGVLDLQIVDDLNYPAWYPSWFFDNLDMSLPSDWICNIQHDDHQLIMGPSFVAKDEDSYNAIVQLEPEPVQLFWERVKASSEE